MKIKKLVINNFRQYLGEHSFSFAHENRKNVTIIHGSNGAGKTALLNALRWGFYGKHSLPNDEPLYTSCIRKNIKPEDKITVSVEIEFEHELNDFSLVRKQQFRKVNDDYAEELSLPELTLDYIDTQGISKSSGAPQNHIRQIIPEGMHPYFFFDGEDINRLGDTNNSSYKAKIKDAIKNLMELTIVDNGILHLQEVAAHFRKEAANAGTEETKELEDKIASLEKDLASTKNEKDNLIKENLSLEDEKERISKKQLTIEPLKNLEEKRKLLEQQQQRLENSLIEREAECLKKVREYAALPFISDAVDNVIADLEDKRAKGVLPAGIKEKFMNDLLNARMCICQRDLIPGSAAYKAVEHILNNTAGLDEIESAITKLSGYLNTYDRDCDDLKNSIGDYIKNKTDVLKELKIIKDQLEEIHSEIKEIGDKHTEDPYKLEDRRVKILDEIMSNQHAIGRCDKSIENLVQAISDNEEALLKAKNNQAKFDLATKRHAAAKDARKLLSELNEVLIARVKENVSEEINSILLNVTGGYIKAEVTNDFQLKTLREIEGSDVSIAKSTGQNQVTSLAFIGSLVKIAKQHYDDVSPSNFLRGGEFPMVMDSPFGTLDPTYGPKIAGLIPSLTPQVIVMASGTQWSPQIERALRPRVGKEYVLVRYETNPSEELNIKVLGTEYSLLKKTDSYTRTSVQEVE